MLLKRIGLIIGIAAIVGGFLLFRQMGGDNRTDFYFKDEFDSLNEEMWYFGEWGTGFSKPDKVAAKDGILTMRVNETDRGPFLLSKPIEIKVNSLVTVKRRVKISYSNNQFTGATVFYQTKDKDVVPKMIDKEWFKNFGNALFMVEYAHTTDQESKRPGNHNVRLLLPDWEASENFALGEPIFDEWFEETITYDCSTGRITYDNGKKLLVIKGYRPSEPMLRIWMHPYGFYTGHEMKIDWIEIKVSELNQ